MIAYKVVKTLNSEKREKVQIYVIDKKIEWNTTKYYGLTKIKQNPCTIQKSEKTRWYSHEQSDKNTKEEKT